MIKLPLRNGIQQILENLKSPFEISYTTQSTKIKTANFTYLAANKHLKMSQLGFIQQVKRYAEKVEHFDPEALNAKPEHIRYFRFSGIRPGIYEGYTELDVNGAYWEIAYQKAYISKEIYEKGLGVDKIVRLVALGAMASKKSNHRFTGEKYEFAGETCNEVTRAFFFDIAQTLDDLMFSAMSQYATDILFYWVDAFFVKGEARQAIREIFDRAGLSLKEKAIDRIEVETRGHYHLISCYMQGSETPKTFIHVPEDNRAKFNINRHNETVERAKKLGLI